MSDTWLIEPRDALVIRDARMAIGTNHMGSLDFPSPATVAGCLRTRLGPEGPDAAYAYTKELEVAGPWLVDVTDGHSPEPLCAAPADCFWTPKTDGMLYRRRLLPTFAGVPAGQTDLEGLALVESEVIPDGSDDPPPKDRKPLDNPPPFWRWPDLSTWLTAPSSGTVPHAEVAPITSEWRTHVRLDPEAGTASEGHLFSVEGRRFVGVPTGAHLGSAQRFALGVSVAGQLAQRLQPGVVRLGGEGRISRLVSGGVRPEPTNDLREAILARGEGPHVWRVVLLTPAIFRDGWRPDDATIQSIFGPPPAQSDDPETAKAKRAQLVAACVGRYETLSGWDFAARGGQGAPKPSRRAAPAGSVYWIKSRLPGEKLLENVWLKSLCDDAQDRLDGFGRMLLGVN